jgi:cell fate regulator YaaT (PSP1 superfamily)
MSPRHDHNGDHDDELRALEDDFHDRDRAPRDQTPKSGDDSPLPDVIYRLKAVGTGETLLASFDGELKPRILVVAHTRYGLDLCENLGITAERAGVTADEVMSVERVADERDLERSRSNREKERDAFRVCAEKIEAHRLPMKLISAHYVLDESKALFFFTAESRVDFRELVKDLVAVFRMRIELRQIGVRDDARVTGGCGVCGRVLCCNGVSDRLTPVSIKMAKDQNLSLNSMKISGPCGRLLCCLSYEYQFYKEARQAIPPEGARFHYDGTTFRVFELNIPAGKVRMHGEDGRTLEMPASRFSRVEGQWTILE